MVCAHVGQAGKVEHAQYAGRYHRPRPPEPVASHGRDQREHGQTRQEEAGAAAGRVYPLEIHQAENTEQQHTRVATAPGLVPDDLRGEEAQGPHLHCETVVVGDRRAVDGEAEVSEEDHGRRDDEGGQRDAPVSHAMCWVSPVEPAWLVPVQRPRAPAP